MATGDFGTAVAQAIKERALATVATPIVANGRPDLTGTLDAATQALVAAAVNGARFVSLDRPQGAAEWEKQGTSWVCVRGDTGWRDVTGLSSLIASGNLYVRRTGPVMLVTLAHVVFSGTGPVLPPGALSDGFRGSVTGEIACNYGASALRVSFPANGQVSIWYAPAPAVNGGGSLSPIAAWPTTLPGTPA